MIFTNGFDSIPVEILIKIVQSQRACDTPDFLKDFSIYGCVPGCKWSGGRYVKDFYKPLDLSIIDRLNDADIGVFPTFTNSVYDNLGDKALHMTLAKLSQSDKNGVIFANKALAELITKEYPNLKLSCSISSVSVSEQAILQSLKTYDYVCLKQRSYFHDIPAELKHKCEVILNNACKSTCPFYKEHYKLISSALMSEYKQTNRLLNQMCLAKREYLKIDPLDFMKQGYRTFKFGARSYPLGVQISMIKGTIEHLNKCALQL